MLDTLAESPLWIYAILGGVAIILLFVFFTTKRVLFLGLIGVVALLALALFLVGWLVESDNEKVIRFTKEMLAAAERHDLDGFGNYLSPHLRTGDETKDTLLRRAKPVLPNLKSIKGRQFEVTVATGGKIRNVSCMVDAKGSAENLTLDDMPFNVRLRFIKDSDGEWRVREFEVWNAFGTQRYYPQ